MGSIINVLLAKLDRVGGKLFYVFVGLDDLSSGTSMIEPPDSFGVCLDSGPFAAEPKESL